MDRDDTNQMLNKAKRGIKRSLSPSGNKGAGANCPIAGKLFQRSKPFSYTVAHDLRAPARGTTGYCEVLLEDFGKELSAEAKTVIQQIMRLSNRMEMLTRDLLEFTKISRQDAPLSQIERLNPSSKRFFLVMIRSFGGPLRFIPRCTASLRTRVSCDRSFPI